MEFKTELQQLFQEPQIHAFLQEKHLSIFSPCLLKKEYSHIQTLLNTLKYKA